MAAKGDVRVGLHIHFLPVGRDRWLRSTQEQRPHLAAVLDCVNEDNGGGALATLALEGQPDNQLPSARVSVDLAHEEVVAPLRLRAQGLALGLDDICRRLGYGARVGGGDEAIPDAVDRGLVFPVAVGKGLDCCEGEVGVGHVEALLGEKVEIGRGE
ncbi:hypothetical protein N8I77_005387 [Diaporthe amygdali]|uniref:Uncharacterized protein n=1 Tax=Phomopsis amygdali TaxID=1214568 RepID=A0AAD9W2Q2_PHOAM|nr:hypothetical protein N8I77_005387 [Diaporthe amygdali]